MSAVKSEHWEIPAAFLVVTGFVLPGSDQLRFRLQDNNPPLVSPLETDTQSVHPKLGCEPAQLIAELFGVLWPIGQCGDLVPDDCRELGVQLGGCLGQP
jgi:hypothetical protein